MSKSIIQPNITNFLSLYQRKYIIGRAQNKTDITLNDGTVSRLHAELEISGNKLIIKDLGSSNGTFIDKKQLTPQHPQELNINEKVFFGESPNYLIVECVKEEMFPSKTNVHNKKHREHHHRHYRSNSKHSRKRSNSSLSDYEKKNDPMLKYISNDEEDKRKYSRKDKGNKRSRSREKSKSKTKLKRNKVLSVIQNVKKEEMLIKENERQIKLYNEYLMVKELEMKNDRIERLPKLIPKD